MGVSKINKRKLIIGNRTFYWYVKPDYDDQGLHKLFILSDDKRFMVSYQIGQSCLVSTSFIVIMGKEFGGWNGEISGYRKVATPDWEDHIATPHFVKGLIEWCLDDKKTIKSINWSGEAIFEQ